MGFGPEVVLVVLSKGYQTGTFLTFQTIVRIPSSDHSQFYVLYLLSDLKKKVTILIY